MIDGRREELSGRIQEVYGISKDEADRQITSFADTIGDDRGTAGTAPKKTN
jgi:uncharacterized protein YjbJ (UPF0337 family)